MLRFGVIGYPVAHSLSPQIHGATFRAIGLEAISEKIEVPPDSLASFMSGFRKKFAGVNVTIPHKETIMAFLDEIDGEAKAMGAVNTIVNRNGKLIGYNTDSYGAMMALREGLKKFTPVASATLPVDWQGEIPKDFLRGLRVIVLGAGGASRAVCFGVLKNGGELTILNRHPERAERIRQDFQPFFPPEKIVVGRLEDFDPRGTDILINTTPCGMTPNEKESPLSHLREKLEGSKPLVMDIVYRPLQTHFIQEAKETGCEVVTGERMFLYQACLGFELWTGKKAPFETMEKALYQEINH